MSQKITIVTAIPPERINKADRHTSHLMCDTVLRRHSDNLLGCVLLQSTARCVASSFTFSLSDLRNDMTLKCWSGCSPTHGLRVVQVITEGQNVKTTCTTCRSKPVFKVSFYIPLGPERSRVHFLSKRGWEALLNTFTPRLSLKVRECPTHLVPPSHHAFDQRFPGLEYCILQSNR